MKYILRNARTAFIMVGISGSGKSTWAQRNFNSHEIISLDKCRELLLGRVDFPKTIEQPAAAVFETLLDAQISSGSTICIDNLNLNQGRRDELVKKLTQPTDPRNKYEVVFVVSEQSDDLELCLSRCKIRADVSGKRIPANGVRHQYNQFKALDRSSLTKNGTVITTEYEIDRAAIFTIQAEHGATFIGDIQGTASKLKSFLETANPQHVLVFVGDLCDRSPEQGGNMETLRIVMGLVAAGRAACVMGNHDQALLSCIKADSAKGQSAQTAVTLNELKKESPEFQQQVLTFLKSLPVVLQVEVPGHGAVLVSHAGVPIWRHYAEPNCVFLPSKHERKSIVGGYKTGERDSSDRMVVIPVYSLPGQYHSNQIFGHLNLSLSETGTYQVPYIVETPYGTKICLESKVEHSPENVLGVYSMEPQ